MNVIKSVAKYNHWIIKKQSLQEFAGDSVWGEFIHPIGSYLAISGLEFGPC